MFQARDRFGLDLGRSFVVGDKRADLECGWNAGVRASILVLTGYGTETLRTLPEALPGPLLVAQDLGTVADLILSRSGAVAGGVQGGTTDRAEGRARDRCDPDSAR